METKIKADVFENLRGVGCPMNLVKTKVAFSKMQSGQILQAPAFRESPVKLAAMQVDHVYYEDLTPEKVDAILDALD